MNSDYFQDKRYKLQRRFRRLLEANPDQFLYELKRFWAYFDEVEILGSLSKELCARTPGYARDVERIFEGEGLVGATEEENAAIGYGVLRRFASQDDPFTFNKLRLIRGASHAEALDQFRGHYLQPLYDYLDEKLDDRNFVLYALIRYKRLCEWFERERLFKLWESNTQLGEKNLALDLYKFLFENGIEFQIEPWSASGEADMVSLQSSDHPLIADAKIFNVEKGNGKAYLRKGFLQLYQYTCDFNQSVGYLVIFNTSDKLLRFAVAENSQPCPKITMNGKVVFFLVVDLFPHAKPASKRVAAEVVEMHENYIVGDIGTSKE